MTLSWSWMYSIISPKLVDMVIDDNTMAHEVWKRLKDIFHDNNDVRITRLDNEIHNMNTGNLSITDYFQEIKSKADSIANLGSSVSNLSLVTYAISGFHSRYLEIARIIRHRETLPTFNNVRFMVLLKECDMASHNNVISSYQITSSSLTVLVAINLSNPNTMMANSGLEQCHNFRHGSCTYGDFGKRFVPQQELSDEQALHHNTNQSAFSPVKIVAPQDLPK
nr:WRKY family transcription factor [Tanacetum cinerariifolium]